MNVIESGDEIISSGGLFGGTSDFFHELKSFGVSVRYVRENRVENFAELITEKTKLIEVILHSDKLIGGKSGRTLRGS